MGKRIIGLAFVILFLLPLLPNIAQQASAAPGDEHLNIGINNAAGQPGVWIADAGGGDYQSATKVGARPVTVDDRVGLSMTAVEGRDLALMYWMGTNGVSYDLGMSAGYLEIWLYASNPEFTKDSSYCRVDIGSAEWLGSNTYFWDMREMTWQEGWNCFTLKIPSANSENGKADLSAIRWVRFCTTSPNPGDTFIIGGFRFVETEEEEAAYPIGLGPNPFEGKSILLLTDDLVGEDGWPRALQTKTGCVPIRIKGTIQTSEDARLLFDQEVLSRSPDIVIISLGMHDQAIDASTQTNRVSAEKFRENLTYFATSLSNSFVVFITPTAVCTEKAYYVPGEFDYGTSSIAQYASIIRQVGAEYGAYVVDGYADSMKRDLTRYTKVGDGIHLTTYGNVKLWSCISGALGFFGE